MTDEELREIEARAEAATPEPWREGNTGRDDPGWVELDAGEDEGTGIAQVVNGSGTGRIARARWSWISDDDTRANTSFIAHARADVPALIAEVRRLQSALATARAEEREACAQYLEDHAAGCAANDPDTDYSPYLRAARLIRARGGDRG